MKVGDPSFTASGVPGITKKPEENKNYFNIDTKTSEVREHFRHGYHKGIANRNEFNNFMDDVANLDSVDEKITYLTEKIDKLEKNDPTKESENLKKYLRAELFHLLSVHKKTLRNYRVDL